MHQIEWQLNCTSYLFGANVWGGNLWSKGSDKWFTLLGDECLSGVAFGTSVITPLVNLH